MQKKYTVINHQQYSEIQNTDGPILAMAKLKLKEADGYAFKNLSGSDELLPYEDWRLDVEIRARDLAGRLSIEEIAGLMLWSPHQMVPFLPGMPFKGNYGGQEFDPGSMDPSELSDEQKSMVREEQLRNILLVQTLSADTAARWNNRLQALAEDSRWGIPVCISSDPRHSAGKKSAEFAGTGKEVSRWPEGLGMAATFDPELMKQFASVASREYRALGISQALGPQIDLATDPRWMRLEDTMGAQVDMVTAFTKAYCDGLQTTQGTPDGWGCESVAAMVKHWPGGGTGEGGRDAHYAYGKFAVFPGNAMSTHMKPFTQGAFKLDGPTKKAAAVMPYYTVSWVQDTQYGENVGNSYSKYIIHDLLRQEQGFDGIVCTDWGITADPDPDVGAFGSRCFGVEELSVVQRHLRIIENGVDMFGGNREKGPIVEAYALGCEKHGEAAMRSRMERSAARILALMFRLGLFENPYLDPRRSAQIVGNESFVEAGLEAQRRSVVLLKNKNDLLPFAKGLKIYVPKRHIGQHMAFFRVPVPAGDVIALTDRDAEGFVRLVDRPEEADAAVVFMESPLCECYCAEDRIRGGNGYLPISLQYKPYKAEFARKNSIAKGDFRENDCDRSYAGKENVPYNASDLDNLIQTRKTMGDKPVFVVLHMHNPCVPAEFEPLADGILAHFGVENRVLMEILTGDAMPGGRLPLIMPANMESVEKHCEDIFDDITPYVDSSGNRYGYGFGLKYGG